MVSQNQQTAIHQEASFIHVKCKDREERIKINASLLRSASERLKLMINGAAASSKGSELVLHLDVPYEGFELMAKWLFNGELEPNDGNMRESEELEALVSAYETGKALGASPHFLDQVMDEVVKSNDIDCGFEKLLEISEPGSVERLFLVDWMLSGNVHTSLWSEIADVMGQDDDLREQFFDAFFSRQSVGCLETTLPKKVPCAYHVHKQKGLPCYGAMGV